MKIENSPKPVSSVLSGDGRVRAQRGSPALPVDSGEQVGISNLSSTLQKAEAAASAASGINSARVAELRQAISEGRFQMDPERIADGLMDSVRELLSTQAGKA